MDIGGKINSSPADIDNVYKSPDTIKVSKQNESNTPINQQDNNEKEIKIAVSKINKILEGEGTHIQYERHDFFKQMIIRVIDNKTNEVIEEIPSKKILDVVAKMCEMAGILVDKKA